MTTNNIHHDMAGVILVGGHSSRMGQDKARLNYNGQPLYLHMTALLRSCGLEEIVLAGEIVGATNCLCEPVPHQGPARALAHIISQLGSRFRHLLVVPVDMPLLTPALLIRLMSQQQPCHYIHHPLPAMLACLLPPPDAASMRALLTAQQALPLPLPELADQAMRNFNTPEEWTQLQHETKDRR